MNGLQPSLGYKFKINSWKEIYSPNMPGYQTKWYSSPQPIAKLYWSEDGVLKPKDPQDIKWIQTYEDYIKSLNADIFNPEEEPKDE